MHITGCRLSCLIAVLMVASGCPSVTPYYSAKRSASVFRSPDGKLCVLVAGLTREEQTAVAKLNAAQLADVLTMRVVSAGDDVPNMAGVVSYEDPALLFTPKYPLTSGVLYRAVLHRSKIPGNDAATKDVVDDFEVQRPPAGEPTVVANVYPSADQVPENLLKFYLHFSAPMSRGEAYQRIHLLDADGNEVADPFLELGEELWDPDQRRFTLLFDPGRIKRGLKPREEVGPVLEEGKRYTLVVDRAWQDAAGQPLEAEMRKSFEALPPDDSPINTSAWKIEPPQPATSDPVVVRFAKPLDQALLERVVRVVDSNGERVAGVIDITDAETCWQFTPDEFWEPGAYRLVVDTTLEDLAGNSIGRAFDVDVFEPIQKRITTDTVSIPFTIAP